MSDTESMRWLDTVVNRYLSMDPEVATKITAFEGKVIAVDVQGMNRKLYLFPMQGKLKIKDQYHGNADTVLKGGPAALFRMGLTHNVAPMLLKGEIEISGDVRLGREFKKVLNEIDIDWEEQLARMLGDVTANQLIRLGRNIGGWGKYATDSFAADLSEYLQEESRDVVSAAELESFYNKVDTLRNDTDRLRARMEALKKEQ